MEFKDRLKLLRESKKVSVSQLAEKFGKSDSAVRMWELGRSKPDADTLILLSKYFDCSSDYLLGITNARYPENTKITKEIGLSDESIDFITSLQGVIGDSWGVEIDDGMDLLDIFNEIVPTQSFKFLLIGLKALANEELLKTLYRQALKEGGEHWKWGIPLTEGVWEKLYRDATDTYVDALVSTLRIVSTRKREEYKKKLNE